MVGQLLAQALHRHHGPRINAASESLDLRSTSAAATSKSLDLRSTACRSLDPRSAVDGERVPAAICPFKVFGGTSRRNSTGLPCWPMMVITLWRQFVTRPRAPKRTGAAALIQRK